MRKHQASCTRGEMSEEGRDLATRSSSLEGVDHTARLARLASGRFVLPRRRGQAFESV